MYLVREATHRLDVIMSINQNSLQVVSSAVDLSQNQIWKIRSWNDLTQINQLRVHTAVTQLVFKPGAHFLHILTQSRIAADANIHNESNTTTAVLLEHDEPLVANCRAETILKVSLVCRIIDVLEELLEGHHWC